MRQIAHRGCRVVDRNVAFAGLVVFRGLCSRGLCGAASSASAAASISTTVANGSADARAGDRGRIGQAAALPFGRRCADEVIARLKPEQAVFAEVVRARRLYHIENPLTFLVGVLERLDVDIGHRFAVTIEDTAGNGTGRHDLHDNIGESLPGTER